jgi:hypothetical protein
MLVARFPQSECFCSMRAALTSGGCCCVFAWRCAATACLPCPAERHLLVRGGAVGDRDGRLCDAGAAAPGGRAGAVPADHRRPHLRLHAGACCPLSSSPRRLQAVCHWLPARLEQQHPQAAACCPCVCSCCSQQSMNLVNPSAVAQGRHRKPVSPAAFCPAAVRHFKSKN